MVSHTFDPTARLRPGRWGLCLAMLALTLVGCRAAAPGPRTDPAPVEAPPAVDTEPRAPIAAPAPAPAPPPPAPAPISLAILVSDDQPEYTDVHAALVAAAGDANTQSYFLKGQAPQARLAIASIEQQKLKQVVAVGLLAARAARELENARVVFCQVFNFAEHDLAGAGRRGIEAVPAVDDAVTLWASLAKTPTRVGVITGPGHDDLIAAARVAFAKHEVELVHRVTTSDRETVLEFRRMLSTVEGYWLLPDNRVLSQTAIREIMSLARQKRIGVLVNDPRFFSVGGFISAASDPSEIAALAYESFVESNETDRFTGPRLLRPQRCRLEINASIAAHLGVPTDGIPAELLAR